MTNFSPKLEDSTDEKLLQLIDNSQPGHASLASDELTRRTLNKLQKTMVDLDESNKKYSKVIGLFAIIQITIAAFALVLDVVNSSDKKSSIFIAVAFLIMFGWQVRVGDKIMKK